MRSQRSQKKETQSFTLIEMTIVIAVIATLVSISIPRVGYFLTKGRDARRIADIQLLEVAIEAFYTAQGFYPTQTECIGDVGQPYGVCTGTSALEVVLTPYVRGGIPTDPLYPNRGGYTPTRNFYYAYDAAHTVDWCDGGNTANDITAPVLGFRSAETNVVINFNHKDTCADAELGLNQAVYNVSFQPQ